MRTDANMTSPNPANVTAKPTRKAQILKMLRLGAYLLVEDTAGNATATIAVFQEGSARVFNKIGTPVGDCTYEDLADKLVAKRRAVRRDYRSN
jgi:hypothetical protein